jgi:6-phosphogluconolactonase
MRILLVSFLCALAAQGSESTKADPKATLVYIGTYTAPPPRSQAPQPSNSQAKGIYLFRLQPEGSEVFQNVTLVPLGLAADTPNPTALELDLNRRLLFAVNEVDQFEGKPGGSVTAYSIDPAGKLSLLNQRSSMGPRPCQLTLDNDARNAIVANCGGDTVAVLPVGADGRLGEASHVVRLGAGEAACVAIDPASQFAFVCHPQHDIVLAYKFDAQHGKLTPAERPFTSLKPGAAPRRMLFRPDGKFAYVLNGRNSTVSVFAYDGANGNLTEVEAISTLPEYYDGPNAAWELGIHRTGKWLYASNAGHNSVALFNVDAEKGTLTFVEEQGTGGKNPRHFGIEPSSKHLAISNVDSNTVLASRIDGGNGRLKPSGIFADLPSPACVRFLPPPER